MADVRRFYCIPAWYSLRDDELARLALYMIQNETREQAVLCFVLDCGAMCEGCLFCHPEEFPELCCCEAPQRSV